MHRHCRVLGYRTLIVSMRGNNVAVEQTESWSRFTALSKGDMTKMSRLHRMLDVAKNSCHLGSFFHPEGFGQPEVFDEKRSSRSIRPCMFIHKENNPGKFCSSSHWW